MHKRRLTLLAACALSLLIHVLLVGGGEFSLPSFFSPQDEVLESKKPGEVKRVQLNAHANAANKINAPKKTMGIRYVGAQQSPQLQKMLADKKLAEQKLAEKKLAEKKRAKALAQEKARKEKLEKLEKENLEKNNANDDIFADSGITETADINTRTQDAALNSTTNNPTSNNTENAAEKIAVSSAPAKDPTATSISDAAPAFPIQITAELDARYNSIPFTIKQTWFMEGLRYAIALNASRFGFNIRIDSEGRINPAGGLVPEHYQLSLNKKVRSFARYQNGEIHYGKPSFPKVAPLPMAPQDTASLPFHIAVTFNGTAQTVLVTTGNNVYQVRLAAVAEEKIKFPNGVLRTLHLRGERLDMQQGKMTTGYEVWLATDYLNYPVKFIGNTSHGDNFEYRVRKLMFEGKLVIGDKNDNALEPSDEVIPEWIQQRAQAEKDTENK